MQASSAKSGKAQLNQQQLLEGRNSTASDKEADVYSPADDVDIVLPDNTTAFHAYCNDVLRKMSDAHLDAARTAAVLPHHWTPRAATEQGSGRERAGSVSAGVLPGEYHCAAGLCGGLCHSISRRDAARSILPSIVGRQMLPPKRRPGQFPVHETAHLVCQCALGSSRPPPFRRSCLLCPPVTVSR